MRHGQTQRSSKSDLKAALAERVVLVHQVGEGGGQQVPAALDEP